MGRKSFRLVSNGRAKEANLNDQTNPQQGPFSERLKNRGLGVALGMRGSQRIFVLPTQHEVTKE